MFVILMQSFSGNLATDSALAFLLFNLFRVVLERSRTVIAIQVVLPPAKRLFIANFLIRVTLPLPFLLQVAEAMSSRVFCLPSWMICSVASACFPIMFSYPRLLFFFRHGRMMRYKSTSVN